MTSADPSGILNGNIDELDTTVVVAEMDSASDIENIEETFRTEQADWEGLDRASDGWPAAVTS